MPKVLILFDSHAEELAPVIEAAARGARAVRFAEVDVRHTDGLLSAASETGSLHKQSPDSPLGKYRGLESIQKLTDYDAVLLAAGDHAQAMALVDLLQTATTLEDVVSAVVVPAASSEEQANKAGPLLAALGRLGMILISSGNDPEATGRRAAKLAGWVRHAKGHEHHHHA